MEIVQSSALKPKTHVLLIGILLMIINMGFIFIFPKTSSAGQVSSILFAIAFNLLTLFWCVYDSRERGEQPGRYFTPAVVIFGIFALFYYLFKTRGFKSGALAIAKIAVIFSGTIIASAFVFAILDAVLKR